MSCAIAIIYSANEVKPGNLIQDKVQADHLIPSQIQNKKKTKTSTKKTKTRRVRQKVKIKGWPKLHPMSAYQSLNGMRCEC